MLVFAEALPQAMEQDQQAHPHALQEGHPDFYSPSPSKKQLGKNVEKFREVLQKEAALMTKVREMAEGAGAADMGALMRLAKEVKELLMTTALEEFKDL